MSLCADCNEVEAETIRSLFCAMCKSKRSAAAKHSSAMKLKFGISDKEYLKLLESQGGHCYLCPRVPTAARRLAVDHDHATGLVRGLLCMYCNRNRLGKGREDAAMHRLIAAYLEQGPAKVAICLGRQVVVPTTAVTTQRRRRRTRPRRSG